MVVDGVCELRKRKREGEKERKNLVTHSLCSSMARNRTDKLIQSKKRIRVVQDMLLSINIDDNLVGVSFSGEAF